MTVETSEYVLPCVILVIVLVATAVNYYFSSDGKAHKPSRVIPIDTAIPKDRKPMTLDVSPKKRKSNFSKSSVSASSSSSIAAPKVQPANDVWEERRKNGIVNTASNSKTVKQTDKPFGSSYYYAHNNSNAKGGYSDGLNIEDYTMNGPRLLSKGGHTVSTTGESSANSNATGDDSVDTPTASAPAIRKQQPGHSKGRRNITRYLWDDEGDDSGMAVIRIDQLPNHTATANTSNNNSTIMNDNNELIDYIDANVTEANAKIVGDNGLLASIKTADVEYRLYIKQLYGKVSAVKAVTNKPKRLLIRIYKKKDDKANLKAWPHPQKKS